MPFVPFIPQPDPFPQTIQTSGDIVLQMWQELVMRRYAVVPENQAAYAETAHFVDQARIYFLDAVKSEWRSAGLLYYYSFLNLAKVLLAVKGVTPPSELKQTSIYHGLSADPQNPPDLVDFSFVIHPSVSSANRKNIFALMYRAITNRDWPFNEPIQISLREVAGYCFEISVELTNLCAIMRKMIAVHSLIRVDSTAQWFEMRVSASDAQIITNEVQGWALQTIPGENTSEMDRADWFFAYHVIASQIAQSILLRSNPCPNGAEGRKLLLEESRHHLGPHLVPTPVDTEELAFWYYVPKVTIQGEQLHWHPVLSDYLFSFVLSTVLRYQPYLLEPGSHNYFLAEAWCNQSPITALRYFLMFLTSPPIRIKSLR